MHFEYKVVGSPSEADMNALGAQGWELVCCEGARYTFRRPKPIEVKTPPRETFSKKTK